MKTKDRLAEALREAGLTDMARRAERGYYDEWDGDLDTPIMQLVQDLEAAGRPDLSARAKNGEWDATKEEAEAWWEREGRASCPPEMRHLFERKG